MSHSHCNISISDAALLFLFALRTLVSSCPFHCDDDVDVKTVTLETRFMFSILKFTNKTIEVSKLIKSVNYSRNQIIQCEGFQRAKSIRDVIVALVAHGNFISPCSPNEGNRWRWPRLWNVYKSWARGGFMWVCWREGVWATPPSPTPDVLLSNYRSGTCYEHYPLLSFFL